VVLTYKVSLARLHRLRVINVVSEAGSNNTRANIEPCSVLNLTTAVHKKTFFERVVLAQHEAFAVPELALGSGGTCELSILGV